jgi:hypothetical protein
MDNDGAENGLDCEPLINSVDSIPGPVPFFVTFEPGDTLTWLTERQSNVFNIYRMSVAPGAPFAYDFACAAEEVPALEWAAPLVPVPGELLAYVVNGRNTCGDGPLGNDSEGAARPAPAMACLQQNADSDSDLILDLSDNCPQIPNPGQEDQDMDGLGDVCDPCPAQPSPEGVGASLMMALDLQTLSWSADPAADSYEVFRGQIGAGQNFVHNYECIAPVATTSYVDSTLPGAGEFLYYLVTSQNACGSSGPGESQGGGLRPFMDSCTP